MAGEKEDKDDDILITEEPAVEEQVDSGEIDSTADEAKDKKEVKQLKKPVKRRGNDEQKRINELWLGKKEAIALAEQNAEIARAERAKNQKYEEITANAMEENLNTKRELLTERLSRATTQEEVAKITSELSKVDANVAQIERYKIETQVSGNPQKQATSQQQQRRELSPDELYENLPPAGKAWMDQNRDWYDPSGESYDEERAADVKYYAQTLESQMHKSGRAAEIGTRSYFNNINNYIKQAWSDDVEENSEEESAPVVEKKKSFAAPVGNRSIQNPSPGARKEYKITQAEKELALSLDTKGADGKPLSDTDKVKRFVTLREKTPSSGPITIQSLKGAK